MLVYRLASRRYAADNSEGARLYGGRWNTVGTPAIYASTTRSLAALEVIVHNGAIPWDFQVIEISIAQEIQIKEADLKLPDGWTDPNTQAVTAEYGTKRARSLETAVLRVPSAVNLSEFNYVLNPMHPDLQRLRSKMASIDEVDPRLRG